MVSGCVVFFFYKSFFSSLSSRERKRREEEPSYSKENGVLRVVQEGFAGTVCGVCGVRALFQSRLRLFLRGPGPEQLRARTHICEIKTRQCQGLLINDNTTKFKIVIAIQNFVFYYFRF